MRTIIAGSRNINVYELVLDAIRCSNIEISEVICGEAKGIDILGKRYAEENGIPTKSFPADWNTHGRAAGPIRNKQMAEYGEALIAIWDGKSKGTKNMINVATSLGLRVYVHLHIEKTENSFEGLEKFF